MSHKLLQKGIIHPNAVVARREMERQEVNRLQRLADVKTSYSGNYAPGNPSRPTSARPGSASRSRPGSRPGSRPMSAVQRSTSQSLGMRQRGSPSQVEVLSRQLLKGGLEPYQIACAAAAAAVAQNQRRAKSAAPTLGTSFMTSPQRRFDDTARHLPVHSEVERKALLEELQSWYFALPGEGDPNATRVASPTSHGGGGGGGLPPRLPPPLILLEEAAAAVKARVSSRSSPTFSDGLQIQRPASAAY
eukprot:TRINITY_DN21584_c3_g1_i1.p1 TRINITY_DN21584_c3_g1~~TRINITY_DN21584_c3_g1_i1.p1  ORF type:complete len:247 (+),score=32.71 TRINITY_DN21584_c3_g1_i1:66-806(+)